jgi:ligand-binding sensor domain-containing protein
MESPIVRYGSEHGLPGNSIIDIVLDDTGHAWAIASGGHLSWLEDDAWRPCGLPADSVPSCLAVGPTGNVWVGTATGLLAIDRRGQPAATLPFDGDYIPGEPPRAIAVVNEGDAWGCSAQGLFHFEDGHWARRSDRTGILTLAVGDGVLWLGTLDGLTRIDLHSDTAGSWKRGTTTALAIAAGGVWAASGGQVGLTTGADWRTVGGQSPGLVTALVQTDDGTVCVGTVSGLLRCGFTRSEPWSTEAAPDVIGLSGALGTLIQAIAVGQRDGESVVWTGTPAGLFEFVPATGAWRQLGGRRVEDVRALAAGDGFWVGSWPSGLRELRDGSLSPPIMGTPILALAADAERDRCFAAGTDAVYLLDGSDATTVVTAEELQPGTWFNTVALGADGTLWIGAAAGLFAYAEATGTTVVRGGDLVGTDVLAVLCAGSGNDQLLLVGTARGLHAGAPDHLIAVDALAGRAVTALAWDEVGTAAWVGTHAGLVCVAQYRGDWIATAELTAAGSGMAADRVTSLAVGNDGRLWIGTPSGLSSFER